MKSTRAFEIVLTIPDNEALTALATLHRLGIDAGDLRRADLWRFRVDSEQANALPETLRALETVFNPNKHVLRERTVTVPEPSEVWIDEVPPAAAKGESGLVAGRRLPGVERAERFTAWRLYDHRGGPAAAEIVDGAVETLLCNPAFQRAIR